MLVKKEFISVGRPSFLRHTNALTILKLLREAGSCSRADLVRASGLSAPTVTNIVSDLEAADLIKPLGEGESSGGRPPDMISFNAARGCLLAVDIKADHLSFLLTDLRGNQLDTLKFPLKGESTTPDSICELIRAQAAILFKRNRSSRRQLLALIVGVPAITDVGKGIVVSISPFEGWRAVPLRTMLKAIFRCLVVIENDTNLAALGERYRGAAQAEETFILINIGANVSAGIVLGGKVHHGAQWSAGEIAYMRLPGVSRKFPSLYEFGELETLLTSAALIKEWKTIETRSETGRKLRGPQAEVSDVLNLAQQGNAQAKQMVMRRAILVSDILVNLSLILNPGLILLGGEVGSHPCLLSLVSKELERCEFAVTRIASAGLEQAAAVLWGAIAIALEEIPYVLLPSP